MGWICWMSIYQGNRGCEIRKMVELGLQKSCERSILLWGLLKLRKDMSSGWNELCRRWEEVGVPRGQMGGCVCRRNQRSLYCESVKKEKWGERVKGTLNFGFASCNAREISHESGDSVPWGIIWSPIPIPTPSLLSERMLLLFLVMRVIRPELIGCAPEESYRVVERLGPKCCVCGWDCNRRS